MAGKRSQRSASLKAKVALAAVKEVKTLSELSSQYGVHSTQIHQWKRQLLEGAEEIFSSPQSRKRKEDEQAATKGELFEQIGRLKMELEWLKKKAALFE